MIGISSPVFSTWPFEEALEKIEPLFDLWEIVSEAEHFIPDIQDDLRDAIDTTNMKFQIHAPYSDINLAAFDARTREYSINVIMDIVRIANDLDIGVVTIHPGKLGPIQSYARDRVSQYTRQSLEKLEKRCREFSVELAFENMPVMKYTICHTAAEMMEMLDGLEMKMCFDVGHAHIASHAYINDHKGVAAHENTTGQVCETDQISEMFDMKDRFANVHLSDNMGDRDRHMALGKGSIDFQQVMSSLSNYQGNYIIETRSLEDGITGKAFLEDIC